MVLVDDEPFIVSVLEAHCEPRSQVSSFATFNVAAGSYGRGEDDVVARCHFDLLEVALAGPEGQAGYL
jgi:hypothetical protein